MNFNYEKNRARKGAAWVIGCDEVGRGSLAGPVVAAAAVLPINRSEHQTLWKEIKDSKLLNSDKRSELSEFIKQYARWSVGVVSEKIIDKINIHNATLLAMRRAVNSLIRHCEPQAKQSNKQIAILPSVVRNDMIIVVDGKFAIPNLLIPQEAIVGGDNKIISIAAASIIAKVYRDELMGRLHKAYPVYNFAKHKGYGTTEHCEAIVKHGLSPVHRLTFCSRIIPLP